VTPSAAQRRRGLRTRAWCELKIARALLTSGLATDHLRGTCGCAETSERKRGLKSQQKLDDEVGVCLREGDIEGAAARVLQGCGACIRGYLRVALGEDRLVRDAFSTFSEAVWQRIRRYRAEQRLVVWAHRLAYVAAKERRETSRLRKPSTTRKAKPGSRELSRTRAATLAPLGAAEDAELMRRELSLEEQTLLTLRIDRQFAWGEIASSWGAKFK
jgi:RNA polymerase sigma-70 factor (ECF subfamily)